MLVVWHKDNASLRVKVLLSVDSPQADCKYSQRNPLVEAFSSPRLTQRVLLNCEISLWRSQTILPQKPIRISAKEKLLFRRSEIAIPQGRDAPSAGFCDFSREER